MIDLYVGNMTIKRIDSKDNDFRVMFENKQKCEVLSVFLSKKEFVKLQKLTQKHCETMGLIPVIQDFENNIPNKNRFLKTV